MIQYYVTLITNHLRAHHRRCCYSLAYFSAAVVVEGVGERHDGLGVTRDVRGAAWDRC